MSEDTTTDINPGVNREEPRGTIGVERKVNLGNYEHEVISIFVQFPVTFGDEAATAAAANDAIYLGKSVLYSQLGLPTELDDGVLKVKAAFGGAPAFTPPAAQPDLGTPAINQPGIAGGVPAAAQAQAAQAVAGTPSCPVCGGALYDNRAENVKRLAEGKKAIPEGRCKQYAPPPKGLNCPGVIWSFEKGK